AAFCQGVILGGLIEGIKVENGAFAGGSFDWATPFAAVCGLGLVAGYALLGATWLIMKTEGNIADRARPTARVLLLLVLVFMALVMLSIIFGYTHFVYWIFSGKLREGEGYH